MEKRRQEFWTFYLQNFKSELVAKFNNSVFGFDNLDKSVDKIVWTVYENLDSILLSALVSYISVHKTKGNETSVYDSLFDDNHSNTIRVLEDFSPKVFQDINFRILKFKYNIFCCLDRSYKRWSDICDAFGMRRDSELSDLLITSGDAHALGYQTVVFKFNGNSQGFVYKSIHLGVDMFINKTIDSIERNLRDSRWSSPKILSYADDSFNAYGYIEFIKYGGDVKNKSEVKNLFYQFGKLLAYGKVFKITDGHADNVIVSNPNIFWIDLETAFHTFISDLNNTHPWK